MRVFRETCMEIPVLSPPLCDTVDVLCARPALHVRHSILQPTYLSKMTAAILDDLNYVVDPSKVSSESEDAVDA